MTVKVGRNDAGVQVADDDAKGVQIKTSDSTVIVVREAKSVQVGVADKTFQISYPESTVKVAHTIPQGPDGPEGPQGPAGPMDEFWQTTAPTGVPKRRWVDTTGGKAIEYGWSGSVWQQLGGFDQAAGDLRYLKLAGGTLTGLLLTAASAAGAAGVRLPHGTAPSTPVNGDLWTTSGGVYARVNAATVGPFISAVDTAITNKVPLAGGTMTGPLVLAADPATAFQAATRQYVDARLPLAGGTMAGLLTTVASSTGTAGFRLPHGVAPSAPVNGDLWTTTVGLYARVNGTTVGPFGVAGAGAPPVGTAGGDLSGTYPNPAVLTSPKWTTGRTIALTGDVTGTSVAFDGTANLSFATTVLTSPKWTTGRTIALTGDITGISGAFDGTANLSFVTAIGVGVIVDADVAAGAAIAQSKIATLTTDLAAKVPLAGGTMTGLLTLSADPSAALHAATKQYVDTRAPVETDANGGTGYGSGTLAVATGINGTAMGKNALALVTTGTWNTAIGVNALYSPKGSTVSATTTASEQVCVGVNAGAYAAGTGDCIIAIGSNAVAHSSGIAIGGYCEARGLSSIAIGRSAVAQGTQSTAIGYGAVATLANQIMLGTATETVYVAGGTLCVNGSSGLWGGKIYDGTFLGIQARAIGGAGGNPALMLGSVDGTNTDVYLMGGGASGTGRLIFRPKNNNTYDWVLTSTEMTAKTPLVLPADPATALQAATKQYADSKVVKTGDTMTGPIRWTYGSNLANYKELGGYYNGAAAATGAIVLTLGTAAQTNNVMLRIRLRGYEYGTTLKNGWEIELAGYWRGPLSSWLYQTAKILTPGPYPVGLDTVQFGYLTATPTQPVIILGTVAGVWEYPAVVIEEVHVSYTGGAADWAPGWAFTLATDLSAYTISTPAPTISRVADKATVDAALLGKVNDTSDTMTGDLDLRSGALRVGTVWDGLWQGMQATPVGGTYATSGNAILIATPGAGSPMYVMAAGAIHLRPSGVATDYSFTNTSFIAPGTITATAVGASQGFNCGSVAVASATDLSKHLDIYGGSYGLSVTSSTCNLVAGASKVYPFNSNGFNDTFRIITANGVQISAGTTGKSAIIRNDGSDFYILISDTWNGSFNTLRPFSIDMATSDVFLPTNYGRTTTNAANMNFYADNRPVRSTSTYRLKYNIIGLDGTYPEAVPFDRRMKPAKAARLNGTKANPFDVLGITPVQFVSDSKLDKNRSYVGCIAEDVQQYASWAVSVTGDSIEWPSITAALLHIVKDHQATIQSLIARVSALEGAAA